MPFWCPKLWECGQRHGKLSRKRDENGESEKRGHDVTAKQSYKLWKGDVPWIQEVCVKVELGSYGSPEVNLNSQCFSQLATVIEVA